LAYKGSEEFHRELVTTFHPFFNERTECLWVDFSLLFGEVAFFFGKGFEG